MNSKVFVYDPTTSDKLSSVRGIGRYLEILKENFSGEFEFISKIRNWKLEINNSVFVNPFFNFLQPPLTLKRTAHKQIAVIHDLIPLKYPEHFPAGIKGNVNILLNKIALKNYDLIVTDSLASKNDIIKILGIKEDIIKVMYPCLPQSFLKLKTTDLKLNENLKFEINNFCLYVGDATWNKNLVNIAKAIKIANVTCVFVGKVFQQRLNLSHPWQLELKQFFKDTINDKRFIFTGFVPDLELFNLYQQASLNLLLSRAEGFGFSWLEAANFSCPSILSAIPVLKEISNGQALFANHLDPYDIADKIKDIYFNKALKIKIGLAAHTRAQDFSSKKFRKEFLAIV